MPARRTKAQVARDIEAGEKVCIKCGKMLPMTEFTKYTHCPDGRKNVCKDCQSKTGKRSSHQKSTEELAFDIETQSKVCPKCKTRKPFDQFYKGRYKSGVSSYCKHCNNSRNRDQKIRSYGITIKEFNTMRDSQDNRCLGCGSKGTARSPLNIDHSHSTGKVRGLLCGHCNIALGHVMDSPETLRNLADYLESFK